MIQNLIKKHGWKKIILTINDLTCLLASAFLALYLSVDNIGLLITEGMYCEKIIIFLIGIITIIPILKYYQLYKHKKFLKIGEQTLLLFKAVLVNSLLVILLIFIIRTQDTLHQSRTQVILYAVLSFLLLFTSRILIFRKILVSKYARRNFKKILFRRVIAIGAGALGKFFAESISLKKHYHIDLVGFLDDDVNKKGEIIFKGYQVVGTIKDLPTVIDDYEIDEIYITIQKIDNKALLDLIEKCKQTNCLVNLVSSHFDIINVKWDDNEYYDLKIISVSPTQSVLYSEKFKRIFDIIVSFLLIVLLSVPALIIALLIKITSRGPVFYKTEVIGKDGKPFSWYKFRTMYTQSDPLIHREHLERLITENLAMTKIVDDKRITGIGKILRKFSLDEIPQLFNVLKGNMSLVGPRPCLPYEFALFKDWHKLRVKVIPGLTGLSQIIARNRKDVTFNDSIVLDLYYADNQSFWLDLKILFKTFPLVVFGKGGV